MSDRIIAEKALPQIEAIIRALVDYHDQLPANVQRTIERLYEIMLGEYAGARFDYQRGAAVVLFLEALDRIVQVRDYAGALIDTTKGQQQRGTGEAGDPTLLDRLPPTIGPERTSRAMPPDLPSPIPYPRPYSPITRGPIDWSPIPSSQPGGATSYGDLGPTRDLEATPESAKSLAPATLTRYPNLEYPGEVVLGERTSLMVGLLREAIDPATVALMIADTTPDKLPEIEVVLRARGFDVLSSNTQLLQVERDDDSEVRFVLIPRVAGAQTIRVDFYQNGRRIGDARCLTMVVAAPSVMPSPVVQPSPEPLEFASAAALPPDIELRVETDPADARVLYFTLHSCSEDVDYHHADMGSKRLQGTPLEKMQIVYAELSKFAGTTPANPDDVDYPQRRLASLGRLLWDELFSDELKAAYWRFRDKARVLLITSDEPWIPWEVVKPYRFDEQNNRLDEPHLCEQFNVA
ncbi:MAG: hypothetical protein JOZ51_10510, partial [Chloroflexi bacterium]|nr:hypothetical protein [Chloroflexota bacterium]